MRTVLFIGGAWDGRSERVDLHPRREVVLRPQMLSYLHPLADPPTFEPIRRHTYELDGVNFGDDKKPLLFYRLSALSPREAVALLLAGYKP